MSESARLLVWAIAAVAAAGVLLRPYRTPEALWAVAGGALLAALGLLPWRDAAAAVARGTDVYLFLGGMILLSEAARREGLFDALAAFAVNQARGSPRKLFALIYAAGIVTTAFLSNDATAVVLTPAVFAAARRANADPMPHLFACALVANAASFILPISNPANLVLYGNHIPALGVWLARFALPSLAAVAATFAVLWWVERASLQVRAESGLDQPPMTRGAWICLAGLAVAVVVLMTVSALGAPLGLPTALVGLGTAIATQTASRSSLTALVRGAPWSIIPLVAGLFVIVAGLERTGAIDGLANLLGAGTQSHARSTAWAAGVVVAAGSNLINNLPAGLMASLAAAKAHASATMIDALLIGVDLGPNLSVTGSLATLLWLAAIRREGANVGGWRFLRTGLVVMPPALVLALAARLLHP